MQQLIFITSIVIVIVELIKIGISEKEACEALINSIKVQKRSIFGPIMASKVFANH